jgi:hypothetical protein
MRMIFWWYFVVAVVNLSTLPKIGCAGNVMQQG